MQISCPLKDYFDVMNIEKFKKSFQIKMILTLTISMVFNTWTPICCFSRERGPCGVSETWPHQRGVYDGERHGEEGEAIPGNPICPPPSGAPPLGCSPGCRAVGGGARRHAAASHVRLEGLWITKGCRTCRQWSSHTPLLPSSLFLSIAGVSRIHN